VPAIKTRRLGFALVGLILAGCGNAPTLTTSATTLAAPQAPPVSYAPSGRSPVQQARTAADAIPAALSGMTPKKFSDVHIGTPPRDSGSHRELALRYCNRYE
jgi:hypothetical protein